MKKIIVAENVKNVIYLIKKLYKLLKELHLIKKMNKEKLNCMTFECKMFKGARERMIEWINKNLDTKKIIGFSEKVGVGADTTASVYFLEEDKDER